MKKIIGFVAALFVAASAFAQFRITPNLGMSDFFAAPSKAGDDKIPSDSRDSVKHNWLGMDVGLDLDYRTGNIVFGLENNVTFLGKVTFPKVPNSKPEEWKKGALYNGNLFVGYNIKITNSLDIILGGGIGFGFGNVWFDTAEGKGITVFEIGVPLIARVNCFFTDMIGISLSLSDLLAYGVEWEKDINEMKDGLKGFTNRFNVKVGPVFKF